MAISPLLLAGLLPAAATAATHIGTLKKSDAEKRQEERLAEMRRREEMGLLGMTDKERAAMAGQLRAGSDAAAQAAAAEQNRLMAGLGSQQAGQALEQAALMNEARMRQEQQVEQAVLQADLAEEQRDLEELRALEQATAQYDANRQAARGQIAASAIESVAGTIAQNQLMQAGNVKPTAEQLAYLKKQGLTEEQAAGFLQTAAMYPNAMDYMNRLED